MNIFKKWLYGKSKEKCLQEAREIYQVREFDNELWLTFNGALICPTEMLYGDDLIKALQEIRDLYVQRNTTDEL